MTCQFSIVFASFGSIILLFQINLQCNEVQLSSKLDSSITWYRVLPQSVPWSVEQESQTIQKGERLIQSNDPQQGIELLEYSLRFSPMHKKRGQLSYALACAYKKKKLMLPAAEWFFNAWRLSTIHDVDYSAEQCILDAGFCAEQAQEPAWSLWLYKEALRQFPRSSTLAHTYREIVRLCMVVGEYTMALAYAAEARVLFKDLQMQYTGAYMQARAYYSLLEYERAEQLFLEMDTFADNVKDTNRVSHYVKWAELLILQERYTKALEVFDRCMNLCLKENSSVPSFFFEQWAATATKANNIKEATRAFEYLLSVPMKLQNRKRVAVQLAEWYLYLGKEAKALEHICSVIEVQAGCNQYSSQGQQLMSKIFSSHTTYSQAIDALNSALQCASDTDSVQIYLKRASLYEFALKNYEAASLDYEALLSRILSPNQRKKVLLDNGRCHEKQGNHATAVEYYHQALQFFDEDDPLVDTLVRKHLVHLDTERLFCHTAFDRALKLITVSALDSARNLLNEVQKRCTHSFHEAELQYQRGLLALASSDTTTALMHLRTCYLQYPTSKHNQSALYTVAQIEYTMARFADALNDLLRYVENYPKATESIIGRMQIVSCLKELGRFDEAFQQSQPLRRQALSSHLKGQLFVLLADVAWQQERQQQALELYALACDKASGSTLTQVCLKLGECYFVRSSFDSALTHFVKAFEQSSTLQDSMRSIGYLGSVLALKAQGVKVDSLIQSVVHFHHVYAGQAAAQMLFYRGVYAMNQKLYGDADSSFMHILRRFQWSDWYDTTLLQRARLYEYRGNDSAALAQLLMFSQKKPQSRIMPECYLRIASTFQRKNLLKEAAAYYVLALNHPYSTVSLKLQASDSASNLFQKMGNWHDAEIVYKTVQQLVSQDTAKNASLQLRLGFCALQEKKIQKALDYFKTAIAQIPLEDRPELYYWIGTCYKERGEYDKAIAFYLMVPYFYAAEGVWSMTSEFEAAQLCEKVGGIQRAFNLYKHILACDGKTGSFGQRAEAKIQALQKYFLREKSYE